MLTRNFVAQRGILLCEADLHQAREMSWREEHGRGKIVLKSGVMTVNLQRSKRNAQNTKLSNSEFLRNLGQGYEPKSTFDKEAIHELAKIHANQGRLGGLLKLWLSEKKGEGAPVKSVRSLLQEIETLQFAMAKLVMKEARRL